MTGKDLFEVINNIDDTYVEEGREESAGKVSPPAEQAPSTRPILRILKRYGLPAGVAAAVFGIVALGLWSSGLLKDTPGYTGAGLSTTTPPESTGLESAVEVPTSTTPPESTGEIPASTTPSDSTTGVTNFHGDVLVSVYVPEDKYVEKDGSLVPSVLELTITNEGTSPLYIEEVFTLQKEGDDGDWEDGAVFRNETLSLPERCVAAGDTSVIQVSILPEHFELWSGPARLILNVHFYEPDDEDWTTIDHETNFYMKAVDFYLDKRG